MSWKYAIIGTFILFVIVAGVVAYIGFCVENLSECGGNVAVLVPLFVFCVVIVKFGME